MLFNNQKAGIKKNQKHENSMPNRKPKVIDRNVQIYK